MKKYVVEEKPLQAVLDYLATKPYKETVTLISNIQASAKLLEETKSAPKAEIEKLNNVEQSRVDALEELSDA